MLDGACVCQYCECNFCRLIRSIPPAQRRTLITLQKTVDIKMNFTHELSLTEEEARIFNVLRETVAYKHRSTCVRVAGGWVRDKVYLHFTEVHLMYAQLLGLPNDDIDIALDDQLGSEFAMSVNEYLQHVGIPTSSICVIQVHSPHHLIDTTKCILYRPTLSNPSI